MIAWRTSSFLVLFLGVQLSIVIVAAVVVFQVEVQRFAMNTLAWWQQERQVEVPAVPSPGLEAGGRPAAIGRFPVVKSVIPQRSLFDPAV